MRQSFRQGDYPVEVRETERVQQHRVHRAEHCGVGAHAQRQSQHCHQRKTRTLAQHAQAITHILQHSFHHMYAARFPAFFLHALHPAKLQQCPTPGLVWIHASVDIFRGLLVQVETQFRVKLPLGLFWVK